MPSIKLYHMPGSCSRVTLVCLEQIGTAYEDFVVNLMDGKQRSLEYLSINPKGKVPALLIDGTLITETPAITNYLARNNPNAGILPVNDGSPAGYQGISDMSWCASAMQPLVNLLFRPDQYGADAAASVRIQVIKALEGYAETVVKRVSNSEWWYGDTWSAVDAYLCWIFDTASHIGFPLEKFSALSSYLGRVAAHPAYVRARAREHAAMEAR